MQSDKPAIFIATLGGQPQVVTLALDALLLISEATILHSPPQNAQKYPIHKALHKLDAEFKNGRYARPYPILASSTFLHAIQDEIDTTSLLGWI